MNARFAEPCREAPLTLLGPERLLQFSSIQDRRTTQELACKCDKDIFVGFFFDGTNNNKYRDRASQSHSNVARLFEVFPGTPATQTKPLLLPKVTAKGKVDRPVIPDRPFQPKGVSAEDYPYYRKVYIPGLGTPMPDVGDSGTGAQRDRGLAFALLGELRLAWAMVQLVNQVHAAITKVSATEAINLKSALSKGQIKGGIKTGSLLLDMDAALAASIANQINLTWQKYALDYGVLDNASLNGLLVEAESKLASAVAAHGKNLPHLRKIRLSVFGFSRGSAEARAWVNMVNNRWGASLAGIPLQIDFLGLFDTVASVGLAKSTPNFEGHAAWAGDGFMPVPTRVMRCVHLVSAHEVRGSFPLDSVAQGAVLPPNCKEIAYPGVHSDVGGGYPPGEQGRALGGDSFKLSQIPLAQMYREALMAGVPLAVQSDMLPDQKTDFAISPKLREDFNAYIAATRTGSVPPTNGKGEPSFARMYPTETQPRGELFRVIRHHHAYYLRWQKAMMNKAGGAGGLACVLQSGSDSRFQDAEDYRGAESELRKEVLFLQSADPKKFDKFDDPLFDALFAVGLAIAESLYTVAPLVGGLLGALTAGETVKTVRSAREMMKAKQREWDTWLHDDWAYHGADALPEAAQVLFENYVHDSRAWFKALLRTDALELAPNDEDWFVFGGRERESARQQAALNAQIVKQTSDGNLVAAAEARKRLQLLKQEGQPLIHGGREPYRMWGYLRHRVVFQAGKLADSSQDSRQKAIEKEEADRLRERHRERLLEIENQLHKEELAKIEADRQAKIKEGRLSGAGLNEYLYGASLQKEYEKLRHEHRVQEIEAMTAATN